MELNQNEIAIETENVSKEGDEILTTELDEEECVRTKKKSRRVSFADITSVHVFDRDEDFETPPDSKPNAGGNTIKTPPIGSSDSQPKGLQHKDIDQHLQVTPTSSLQKEEFKVSDAQAATPVSVSDKGSPGEDREFFGPVSLWHIAPGMSVCSPVEDDITLDCTTFSLQFGKLMNPDKQCSNLAEVVKTPLSETGVSVLVTQDFETPVEQSGQPSSENTMALTQPKQARWWMVSNGKTLDNCEGMNAMCSSQEKQIKYEYESMSPYLELMLAEKLSEVQPGVSFEEHNQEKEHLRSSCSHTDSAFRKTGQGMKSQDSAGVKIKTSIMESEEYTKQGSAILPMDQLTIENMSNNPNKGTGLTTAANSFVFDFDMGNLQQQQQSPTPQWKFEPNSLVDKEMDGCFIDIIATECSKNTKMMLDAKIKQSIIETGGTEQQKTTEVMEGENCPSIKFETEQQEKQTRRLSDSEIGMEPKKYADLEMHGSTTGIMAAKPCNGSGYMITLEGNQSMTVTADLERENSSSLLNSETDHSQEKVKEIAALNLSRRTGLKDASDADGETCNIDTRTTENNAIESGHSTAEIAAPITKEDTHLRLLDDSHFEKSEEHQLDNSQEEEKRLLLNLAQNIEVKDPVKNELETSAIDVIENKQNIHTKLASHGEMKQTLEIMVFKQNKDDRSTFSDCLPVLNCNGKDQMQQLLWKSEMKMDPQRSLNLEKEISTIPVSIAQNNKTNVTDKKEMDHPMGITAASDKKDAIFVQDREKNPSLAQLHKQVKLAPPQCTTHFNPEEEHHQQKQEESSISSKVFKIHGKSKLSEDRLNGNSKEAGSILKPIEMNITMPSNKQELKSFGSIEDTVLLDRCASLNNEYLEGYVKHCPEQDRAEEKGTVIGNDLSSDFPVSNTDIQQVCEHVDSAQTEVSSSVMSQPQIKYFIPRSELSLSKCDAVSDSSVTPLKKQSELENAHKYPFISDENLEDSDLKDMQVSLPFPASVSKSLVRPLDSKDCHEIPNNALSEHLSGLNCDGKDQMQQLLWNSELKMDPQRPLNLEKEISTVSVPTAQKNETNVTGKNETDHPMGITAANHKKNPIFVQDRENNQSLAQLHKQVKLAPPHCTTCFNPEEEHYQQKQAESSISSKDFKIHGRSRLSEDQLNDISKEAGSILKPIEMNIKMPSNKQELKPFGSIEDTVLLDRRVSLNNVHLEGYGKHFPEPDRAEERKGTVIGNDLSSVVPVSNTDIQRVCQHVDSAQIEVSSSVMSQPKIKHSIPRSELSLSKCNAVSDSSVTPLKKQSELENAHKYPFISGENLEDSDLKDMQVSLPFPASVRKSLFRPLDSKDCHEIPNNASSEHLSGLNCDGKDQMQQLLWNSELKMDPQRPLNLEKEISTVSAPTAQKNETNVTGKKETDHPMGITAANDKKDAIFVQDREKNQSIAQLHKQVLLDPPQRTTHFNPEEEHHQQKQEQISSSSKDFKLHGKSKLSEDQLIDNSNEAESILKPIEANIKMPSSKQELGSIEETVLLDRCVSLNNEYLEGYGKHIPEPDIAEERKGTVIGNDLCSIFPVSNRDIRQVCQHVDSTQIEVSSIISQPNIKHSFPRSELSLSKCNAVSDSSVTPLKQQSQLETAHKYPFISDENLEDSDLKDIEDTDSKDIQVSLPFPASVSKSLFRPMDSKECHKIPNYASSDPKDSSGSRVKVNSRLSCQNIDPNLSVSGIDQCKSILSKKKYSKDLNNICINTPLNNKIGLVSDCSMSTQLISTDKKSKIVCDPFDLKPNSPSVHKDASFFGNQHHGLFSNSESVLSPSVLPILSPIRGTMCEMTPLGPIADCGSLPNVKKSNYSSVIRNDTKGCSTSNIFSTPLNLSICGDANYGYSHLDSIEHLNMPGGSNQIDLQSSFQEPLRDTHNANPVSDGHKLIANFMDTCASNRNLMNNDFCSVSHLKDNIQGEIHKEFFLQKKPDFLNCENSKNIEPRDAGIILRNAVDSDHQWTSAVKLNTQCSSTKSNNGEQASCMGTQNVKMNSNCGNVSLPLSEKKCSLSQQNELHWTSFAETQHPNCTSGYISEGPMALQHARGNGSLKTFELACATEKTLSSQALNDRGYLNKKRKCEEMDAQDQGSLIKDHKNASLSFGIESVHSKLSEKVFFESSEGRMPSTKRPFVTGTEPTEDVINVSDEICQEVEELQIPLICKPKTQKECLCFIFSSQPQLCLFQETLKLIQEGIDRMKISSNPQFQALDVKKCSQMENKFLRKSQSWGSLKWLQQVVAYEKSKLLLLQAKKQELMKNVQELHRGCQELDQLKSHYLQMTGHFRGSAKAPISRAEKEAHVHFLEAEIRKQVETLSNKRMIMQGSLHKIEGENRKACERVIVMKRELEVLGDKIIDICNFYCGVLRLKDYKNKEDITKMLKIHVEKRSLATLILKDIQHWIVKDIKYKPGNRFIELAYSDILYQRFVIEGDGPDANVLASNRLDKKIVEKVFPLSNAIEAFGFVLELKQSLKIGGLGSISQVATETSFLYCTLVDVLEEVQTCRMRLQNLSFTQFVRTSGEELHLQLIFIDCTMGLKARVMLNTSNLRCAVYPSDILPCQIDIELFGRQPQGLLIVEELHELTRALKPGYSRIKDLCGCISKFIGSKR